MCALHTKMYTTLINRQICDFFFNEQKKVENIFKQSHKIYNRRYFPKLSKFLQGRNFINNQQYNSRKTLTFTQQKN